MSLLTIFSDSTVTPSSSSSSFADTMTKHVDINAISSKISNRQRFITVIEQDLKLCSQEIGAKETELHTNSSNS